MQKTDDRCAFLENSSLLDDLLQNRAFPGLQNRPPLFQEKPYADVLLGAVENLNRIISRGAIDRAGAILLQELKERLTPGMVEEREEFVPIAFNSSLPIGLMVCSIAARRASVILAMSRFSDSMMVGICAFVAKSWLRPALADNRTVVLNNTEGTGKRKDGNRWIANH